MRIGSKIVFIIFRSQLTTVQGVMTEEPNEISDNMVRWAEGISRETIVRVEGIVQQPPENQETVKSASVHEREIRILKVRSFNEESDSICFDSWP